MEGLKVMERKVLDSIEYKLLNRRTRLFRLEPKGNEDGFTTEWGVEFIKLNKGGERIVTRFELSDEALEALVLGYIEIGHGFYSVSKAISMAKRAFSWCAGTGRWDPDIT